ncbi:hypothetical protein [Comamonas sp. JC664]|uniref:hypothetical protein n=1 Tax=Comamonas sp. JC664 TaxID=2801917 RepID=UPI003618A473
MGGLRLRALYAPSCCFLLTPWPIRIQQISSFLLARDILKGKSREDLLAKLDAAGFSGEHAELFIAQAEKRVLARNRRCAVISAVVVAVLLGRVHLGPYAHNPDMQLLLGVMAAIFAAAGFYFWFIARWQAPLPKADAS